MTVHEIRRKYLEFFENRGHSIVSSSSLLPENDPTTLFTGSGMQPMVPYLLGEKHPMGNRIADSQKCFRAEDIEEIGDNRHTTFFEMLGNWSLGDYFKKEQIHWMFEFLTEELRLDPQRIYITVFGGDEEFGLERDNESVNFWKEKFESAGITALDLDKAESEGMRDGRIFYYSAKKNWWSRAGVPSNMPEGEPGGPDAEMFWDFGADLKIHENSVYKDSVCHVNCDCGRFLEIGNNVFMMYKKSGKGFENLPNKNIDFGGGLERLTAVINDNPDVFQISVFSGALSRIEEISGKEYGKNPDYTHSYRVILDHLRAVTFLIADGAIPSNKDSGYFTRRLIRRAIRFGNKLGIDRDFCKEIGKAYLEEYKDAYPNTYEKRDLVMNELAQEETKFRKTLEVGLKMFEKTIGGLSKGDTLPAKESFDLYQTYGFPIEVIEDLANERGVVVNRDGFDDEMRKHQDVSRAGAEAKFKGGLADHSEETTKLHTATHLLHSALRAVLGEHVEQRGSNITSERLRFDFTHDSKMSDEEKEQVERLVNYAIEKNYPVTFDEMTVEEAKEKGAIGLFEDRYGARVKVYSVGDPDKLPFAGADSPTFSKEVCGGPHVESTGVIGKFKIKKEEASSSGIRRIKAVIL